MIKSADAEVRELVEALGADDTARRDAAVARLNIIGKRAVARLVSAYERAGGDLRRQLGVLSVLETSADERALPIVRHALSAGGDLAVAAAGVLRELLGRGTPPVQIAALDLLLAASQHASVERRVRAAAAAALAGAPEDIRSAVEDQIHDAGTVSAAVWQDAAEGRLPHEPDALREAIETQAGEAPLPVLHRMVEAVRARELAAGRRRDDWRTVRGELHGALAARGSRIALYDLREAFQEAEQPLPAAFLSAVERIGDASCLEPLASAFSRAPQGSDEWRRALALAFHAITKRERLTTRHSAVRRALTRAPELKGTLLPR